MDSPLDPIVQLNGSRPRRIVLRRDKLAFILEVHYFEYSHHVQEMAYSLPTGCRFFPVTRHVLTH